MLARRKTDREMRWEGWPTTVFGDVSVLLIDRPRDIFTPSEGTVADHTQDSYKVYTQQGYRAKQSKGTRHAKIYDVISSGLSKRLVKLTQD